MNPDSLKEAKQLFNFVSKQIKNEEIVVCPPFVYLSRLASFINKNSKIKLGAQNLFFESQGAYTGEISPKMLKNLGVEYVIIGHSERRRYLKETDEMINKKVLAAAKTGLKTVLCVGEEKHRLGIKNRKLEIKKAKKIIKNQLGKDLKGIHNSLSKIYDFLIVAYEPVWAIGSDNFCHPADAREIIKFIKNILNSKFKTQSQKVLYGGSVDSKNIGSFIKYPEINGVLVGGASLEKNEIKKIIKIAN